MSLPDPFPFSDQPEFLRLLRGEVEPDLTRLALEIARDAEPEMDPLVSLKKIDELADRVRDRCPSGAKIRHILGQINWVLFIEEGFRGNTTAYQDPRNSYLNVVLKRKLGIPLSLSILYLAIADRLGFAMSGVNLPGHFVIRAGRGEKALFVDPFHEGQILNREGCDQLSSRVTGRTEPLPDEAFSPCTAHVLVTRMLRNLKAAHLQEHDFRAALPVLRRLAALHKSDPDERRDLGIACVHSGLAGEAVGHLIAYLDAAPYASDSREVAALIQVAKREVARFN